MERKPAKLYAAITADVIGSTQTYELTREPIRPKLQEVIASINQRHRTDLAVPFGITLGDEFQCLVEDISSCPRIIHDARLELFPLKCRVGIGIGTVASEMARSTVEMEGAAFSRSREALDAMAAGRGVTTKYVADNPVFENAANTIAMLVDIIRNGWTEKQWLAVRAYAKHRDLARAGAELAITFQAVGQRLKLTHWVEIECAEAALSRLLQDIVGDSSRSTR